jgi:hypothetical protein
VWVPVSFFRSFSVLVFLLLRVGAGATNKTNLMFPSFSIAYRARLALLATMVVIAGSVANPLFAQTDLPPIAAPTTSVAVEILPIVRSESQQVSDYARGLVEGLMAREEISYGALVIVTRDRVDIAEAVGEDVGNAIGGASAPLSGTRFGSGAWRGWAARRNLGRAFDSTGGRKFGHIGGRR